MIHMTSVIKVSAWLYKITFKTNFDKQLLTFLEPNKYCNYSHFSSGFAFICKTNNVLVKYIFEKLVVQKFEIKLLMIKYVMR